MRAKSFTVAWALVAVACEAAPERPALGDFPSAVDDSDVVPQINDCQTRLGPFTASMDGYRVEELAGFGSFDTRGGEDRTTLLLRACKRGTQPKSIALNWYGGGELRKGTFDVSRDAVDKSGFDFIYVDASEEAPMTCSDSPTGTVTIERASANVVKGSFDVEVRCFDDVVLDKDELPNRPALTFFRGTFSTRDIEVD